MATSVIEALRQVIEPKKVVTDAAVRQTRRHDYWMLSQLADHQGSPAPLPACVVQPTEVGEIVAVVDICRQSRAPLVPFGLGSGVCGGVVATEDTVLLDMGSFNKVRYLDATNLLATFEAGVRGSDAEAALTAERMMLGHYPQSIGVSSVGGWIATRAAGQFSTAYGNIEDIVVDIEAVMPNGSILQTKKTPRASAGPDLRHILLGSEGTLGVVTAVTLSVRRLPEHRLGSAFYVDSMSRGVALQREIVQSGWLPVAMRQYDAIETNRMFSSYGRGDDGLLLLVHEGPHDKVEAEVRGVQKIAERLSSDSAPTAAVDHWLRERNHVPSFEAFIKNGVVVDTIEVAATWDRVDRVYDDAVNSLKEVSGILAASAHSSHVYRSGINLYFTFVAQPKSPDSMKDTYLECWRRVMEATSNAGGGISHHHGIGRIRREFLRDEIGQAGLETLLALKRALDPIGFMNPGALLPVP